MVALNSAYSFDEKCIEMIRMLVGAQWRDGLYLTESIDIWSVPWLVLMFIYFIHLFRSLLITEKKKSFSCIFTNSSSIDVFLFIYLFIFFFFLYNLVFIFRPDGRSLKDAKLLAAYLKAHNLSYDVNNFSFKIHSYIKAIN